MSQDVPTQRDGDTPSGGADSLGAVSSGAVSSGAGSVGAESGRDDVGVLLLVREPRMATAWGIPAAMLLVAGLWLLLDARGGTMGVIAFVAFGGVAAVFLVPWLAPDRHMARFDATGITLVVPWRTRHVAWTRVQTVRLSRFAGDPFLEVEALDDEGRVESVGMLLPIGADVATAHEWLADRQAAVPYPDPSTAPVPPTTPGDRP